MDGAVDQYDMVQTAFACGKSDGQTCLVALKEYFGYDSFRGGQEEIVRRILAGEELCVVMPTGAGKSLCYQLPIMMRAGYGLVISPLIALMKDQVDALNARGLRAACVNSSVPSGIQQQALQGAADGHVKFLYVAPERFRNTGFRTFLERHRPSLVVVDEAHCISQWGHDFRPDYQRLWSTVPVLQELQVCAFTATATPHVREDIREQTGRPGMTDIVTGFKRENLNFSVVSCQSKAEKTEILKHLLQDSMPTLIYASTRKEVESVASDFGIRMYHAGMRDVERRSAQEYFLNDSCPVLVATNAFGMGIDRPDVRRVIHFSIPGSLEAYYQEAGRAGRDGGNAECILISCYADIRVQEFLVDMNNPPYEILKGVHSLMLRDMRKDGSLLWMPDEASSELPSSKGVSQISATARILERQGLVERIFVQNGTVAGTLRFRKPLEVLEKEYAAQKNQRSIFVYRLCRWLQTTGESSFQGTEYQLAGVTGFRPDQLEKILDVLNGEVFDWNTGTVECVLQLTELGRSKPFCLDRKWVEKKYLMDTRRLAEIMDYCTCRGCRQAHIISYFGERIGQWRCGQCDHCSGSVQGRELTEDENAAAMTILKAVDSIDGRFGRRRVASMLLGDDDDNALLSRHPYHGALKTFGRKRLGELMDALENGGYLETKGGEYPCLALNSSGLQILFGKKKEKLKLSLFSAPVEDILFVEPKASGGRKKGGGRSKGRRRE